MFDDRHQRFSFDQSISWLLFLAHVAVFVGSLTLGFFVLISGIPTLFSLCLLYFLVGVAVSYLHVLMAYLYFGTASWQLRMAIVSMLLFGLGYLLFVYLDSVPYIQQIAWSLTLLLACSWIAQAPLDLLFAPRLITGDSTAAENSGLQIKIATLLYLTLQFSLLSLVAREWQFGWQWGLISILLATSTGVIATLTLQAILGRERAGTWATATVVLTLIFAIQTTIACSFLLRSVPFWYWRTVCPSIFLGTLTASVAVGTSVRLTGARLQATRILRPKGA